MTSSGTLENNERVADLAFAALQVVCSHKSLRATEIEMRNGDGHHRQETTTSTSSAGSSTSSSSSYCALNDVIFKKISFIFSDSAYVIFRYKSKVYVVHKSVPEVPSIADL